MKTHPSRRNRGFTLVELLVVISIIAVLAAASFAGGNAALQKVRKTASSATATAIVTAVNGFYSDYQALPVEAGEGEDGGSKYQTDRGPGVDIVNVLLGKESSGDNMKNTKKVAYLTVREAKGKKGGIVFDNSGRSASGVFDSWGNPFFIVLDTNYEDRLNFRVGGESTVLNGTKVAVYSAGSDGKLGTSDDVKTW